jgi:hypothetical protein
MTIGGRDSAGVFDVIERVPLPDDPMDRSKLEYSISDKPELEERKDRDPPRLPPTSREEREEDDEPPECCIRCSFHTV